MSWVALVLGYGFQTALFYFASFIIKRRDDEFKSLKMFLFLYAVIHTFIMGLIPLVLTASPDDATAFRVVAISLFSVNVLGAVAFILLYGANMLVRTLDLIRKFTTLGGKK